MAEITIAPARVFVLIDEDGELVDSSARSPLFEWADPTDKVFEYGLKKEVDLSTFDPEDLNG